MQAVFNHLDFFLNIPETFSLTHAARTAMTVKRGSVWVTQDGNREDYVLEAGQSLRITGDETVIVSALRASEVALDEMPQRGRAQRFGRSLLTIYLRWGRHAMARARRRHYTPGFV